MKYLIANQEICKSKFSLLHKFNFLKNYIYVKDSEYPFKQNENMLKNKTVLLYTYFYNISFNVLRLTFFNVYNLPFLRSTNYFFYFMSSCINKIAVFNTFFCKKKLYCLQLYYKNRLFHRCFPVNFAKFLGAPFLRKHFQWLLLKDGKL